MLIGVEYDKIEFQLFGLDLLEPNGVFGDIIIFALSIFFAYKIKKYSNGYRIYVDIMTGENCRKFWLLTWTSSIGQFVHPVGR